MADWGLPLTLSNMQQYATYIVNSEKQRGGVVLEKQSPRNFINRHPKQLSMHWSSPPPSIPSRPLPLHHWQSKGIFNTCRRQKRSTESYLKMITGWIRA